MNDKYFYGACLGFIGGVLSQSLIDDANLYFAILGFGISLVLFLIFKFVLRTESGRFLIIFLFAFSLGLLAYTIKAESLNYVYKDKDEITLIGTIIDEPDVRITNQKLLVLLDDAGHKTKVLATTNLSTEYRYGDEINISGRVLLPQNFMTNQGKEFDYANYLKKDGILYLVNYADIEILTRDNGNGLKAKLFAFKAKFLEQINFAIPEPENLLMGGLILGEKANFSDEMRQSFVDTGTIHIVALSGYNVTIIAEWFMKIFKFLSQTVGISVGIILIWLFVLMTGMSSTAVRAGIMASLALVARATGRSYDVARALVLAAVIMIAINPYVLVHDVSFQLSFIATIAVIFLAPRFEKYFMWVTDKFELRDIVTVTAAAYVFVMPFILYKMGNLSLTALPANILILPFIPFTMMLGFVTGALGLAWYGLAVAPGYLAYLLLFYELYVIDFFASFSFGSFVIPNFPLSLTLAIYAYFIYAFWGKSIHKFFTVPQ